jgi:hypothetical protein
LHRDRRPGRPPLRRLACVAGARLPSEAFDSVAVSFEVVPSCGDAYELENVTFFGGPGIR